MRRNIQMENNSEYCFSDIAKTLAKEFLILLNSPFVRF